MKLLSSGMRQLMTTSPTRMDHACGSPIGTSAAQHIAVKAFGLQQLLHLVICSICIFYKLKLIIGFSTFRDFLFQKHKTKSFINQQQGHSFRLWETQLQVLPLNQRGHNIVYINGLVIQWFLLWRCEKFQKHQFQLQRVQPNSLKPHLNMREPNYHQAT